MIKSSEPGLSNTYRIIRVLSNQDYLATDHNNHRFIFSETTPTSLSPIPASYRPQEALLKHREIIAIDDMQYAVFAVGTQEVVWAPLVRAKKLQQNGFIERVMKQSCEGILKELIWMGNGHANKYLDLKNFWLVGEELRLLLVPRRDKPKFTIKKCEHRSLSGEKSIDQLMEAEKTLMKEFALLLWQICFQCSHYDDQCVTAHGRTKQVLRMMVNRAIAYEQLMKELSKQSFEGISSKKIRYRSLVQQELMPRRKTLSFITPNRSISQSINNSRLIQTNTETLKRPYHTMQKQQGIYESILVDPKPRTNDQMRSSSAESTLLHNNTSFRKSKYLSKRQCTQSSSKETVHFERWLQSKRYSVQTRQKLIRNGEIARKKYSQAIEYSKRQTNSSIGGREEKLDDAGFKAKILSKVIRFKDAMKDKKAIVPTIPEAESSKRQQEGSLDIRESQKKQAISIALRERKEHPSPPIQVETLRLEAQPPKNQPVQACQQSKKEVFQSIKIGNDYIYSAPQEPSSVSSLKTEKKKHNRIDIISANNTVQDLQEVELEQPKIIKPPPKKKPNAPPPAPPQKPIAPKIALKTMEPSEGLNEMVLMVNTLGDMTVRAIKRKQQLADINVCQATYFLYERFQYERSRIQGRISQGQPVCRQHRRVQEREWSAYLSSESRERAVVQMGRENEQITSTLQRLGQKLLQEETVERKIEYFVKNRVKVLEKSDPALRKQLSRFLISSLVSEFDYAWEEQLQSEAVVHFLGDCCFGAYVVGELDAVIPPDKFVRLDQYKEYMTLNQLKPVFDFIDAAYFPKEGLKKDS